MTKILSRSGDSLADVYDVEGSVAGIEQLETRELPIVHEMGSTIFSERLAGDIRRMTTGAVIQGTAFDVVIANLPAGIWRILNVMVFADVAARVEHAAVLLRDPTDAREIALSVWDSTNNVESTCRIDDDGAGVANLEVLVSDPIQHPSLGIGTGQREGQQVNDIALRGKTLSFGAGDVTVVALIYIAHSHVGGISSRGLPIPGW